MIEKLSAENGQTIFKRDGCLLSSRFDPSAEAEAWIESRRDRLFNVQTVVVLGLGSGYHIQALLRKTQANIALIESDRELIQAIENAEDRKFILQEARLLVVEASSLKELRANSVIRQTVQTSFVVLSHPPSMQANSDFYRAAQELLIGRQWGTLTWQWQLQSKVDLQNTPVVTTVEHPLSIHDLEETFLMKDSLSAERMLFKALRELVK